MNLTPQNNYHGFAITSREDLPEIDGEAYLGVHEASGAKLLYLKNDDNNKSFAIGFRTPPQDDTGVFHILEHSVLCGSRRFPVKEPFVDLLKSSMQTFLNAMTFSDKTLYPVASTNEQDLFNLMDVYLDAVFHPQIYQKRAIFEQEGWHLELKANDPQSGADPAQLPAEETTLVYNGVVYNEMKGALSDASSVLYQELQKALLPDTCYAFESGGTPAAIPTLTYEDYLDEHARHYRTDNSYIILYGNLDIDRALAFLDERYLTPIVQEQADADAARAEAGLEPLRARTIALQPAHDGGFTQKTMDTAPENACAACGYVIGEAASRERAMAVDILLDALLGSNEAPLKRALLDEGVAHDIQAAVSEAVAQPFAYIEFSMPQEGRAADFRKLIADHVRKLVDAGLDKDLLEASLSHTEFMMRENARSVPDGVLYSMTCLSSWLYDEDGALDYLRYEELFADLRAKLATDFFDKLSLELFCENAHAAAAEILPTPGQSDDGTAAALEERNGALSPDERAQIVTEEATLRQLQEAPDSPEAIATLPKLTVADIDDMPEEPAYGPDDQAPIACVRHSVPTRGIAYACRYYEMDRIAFEDLPYVAVLDTVLGKLDTAQRTAAELDTLIHSKLGNLTFRTDTLVKDDDLDVFYPRFLVTSSALDENAEFLASIPREVMLETDFSNTAKILDILKQHKIGMEQAFINYGHACAATRSQSYYSKSALVRDQLSNVSFYRFLCELVDDFDARAEELSEKLADLCVQLFCDDRCTLHYGGSDDAYDVFWKAGPLCGRTGADAPLMEVPEPVMRNEAFIVPSDVCFACQSWDRRLLDEPFDGAWLVASRALSYDYLWNEVRVKGGAYGAGFSSTRNGFMRFHSFRDPHLDETLERFAQAGDWIGGFDPSPQDLEGFIVATVATLDAPVKPRMLIQRQAYDYTKGNSPELRHATRSQAIAATVEKLRSFAPVLKEMTGKNAICAFGNREILENASADLEVIPLIG